MNLDSLFSALFIPIIWSFLGFIQYLLVKDKKFFLQLYVLISVFFYSFWFFLLLDNLNNIGLYEGLWIFFIILAAILALCFSIVITIILKVIKKN